MQEERREQILLETSGKREQQKPALIMWINSGDCDKELFGKLSSTASKQNTSTMKLQREILCGIFNIPKAKHISEIDKMLENVIREKRISEHSQMKFIIRNCLREYFGMPKLEKAQYGTNTSAPLKRTMRFEILAFLVTVDAATKNEITAVTGIPANHVRDILYRNTQYFKRFHTLSDSDIKYRATEKGREDYAATSIKVVRARKEKSKEERIVQEEYEKRRQENRERIYNQLIKEYEEKRPEYEAAKAAKAAERLAKKAERQAKRKAEKESLKPKKEPKPKKTKEEQKKAARLRRLDRRLDKAAEQLRCVQRRKQAIRLEKERIREEKKLEREKVKEQKRIEREKAKQEKKAKKPVAIKKERPMSEAQKQYLLRQEQIQLREAAKEAKIAAEAKIRESFNAEKALCVGKYGIERYFLYDPTNPIDMEIVRRVQERAGTTILSQERFCRKMFCNGLRLTYSPDYSGINQVIEAYLQKRCIEKVKTRNDYVRELFCIYFNIKMVEGYNPQPQPILAQGATGQ